MAYSATTWVNGTTPALSAANLNHLTTEIKAQALAESISHTLPTWVDGTLPALSDPAPLNEMERVTGLVATARGISYVKTTWQAGWVPARNATNLNHLEQGVQANSVAVPPSGTLIYSHTYTGAQATPPNYGWDYNFLQEGGSSATVVPNGLAPGVPSMHISLPTNASGHVEGQKQWRPPPGTGGFSIGERRFFGFQFKLPVGWQDPNSVEGWGALIAQMYYPVCINCPLGLYLYPTDCRLQLLSGQQTWPTVTREYDNYDGHPQGPAPRAIPAGRLYNPGGGIPGGTLHTLITEVIASYERTTSPGYSGGVTGEVRVWHRIATDPGSPALQSSYQQTVNLVNVPTMQWGQCNDGSVWPKNSVGPDSRGYYLHQKFGFYTGPSNWTRTYDSGNVHIGDTFAIVAAQMA